MIRRQNAVAEAEIENQAQSLKLVQLRQTTAFQKTKAKLQQELDEFRFKASTIVAPTAGTILEIRGREGEYVGGSPVILLADTSEIHVICDVFEGDILKLRKGMRVTAKSKSLPAPLEGEIIRVERIVTTERKLAKVLIRLDKADVAARLLGMEVQVSIHP